MTAHNLHVPVGRPTTRRRLLAASAASVAGVGLGLNPTVARADGSAPAGPDAMRFAMVTDTHENLDQAGRTADLARVMAHIATRNPAFVVNCGDITDYGVEDEFAAYRATIPATLKDRVHQALGNHEEQWNADAFESFRRNFGPTRYSFDAGGLHVVAMDPMVSQEWNWYFGQDLLEWIDRDLSHVKHGTPIVMFNHFPLGDRWHFVMDGEDFLEVIRPYSVRLLLAGHIHRLSTMQFNGVTQVVGNAIIKGAYYYWAERRTGAAGDYLEISQVVVPEGGPVSSEIVATAPLDDPGPGGDLGPFTTHTTVGTTTATVTLNAPAAAQVAYAQVYPQGAKAKALQSLTAAPGHRWTGTIDISDLPPGSHRMVVRTADGHGVVYDDMRPFSIKPTATRIGWTHRLRGRIQGDLAVRDHTVVAASVFGEVAALRVDSRSARPLWHTDVGGVYKGVHLTTDPDVALAGSVDHHLYALTLSNGHRVWRRDLGAPIECGIAEVEVGGEPRLVVAAGSTLFCLDPSGDVQWTIPLGGIATGKAACDADHVYIGCGDGNAYALDATSGAEVWRTSCTTQTEDYGRLIHGPWAARMLVLPDGGVIASTFDGVLCLEPKTGDVRWSVDGLHRVLYTPLTLSAAGLLAFDGKDGSLHVLDPATGKALWTDATLPRSFGAGPVASADPDVYWMAANNGLLTRIDLAQRRVDPVLQISTAWSTSTAVFVPGRGNDDVLVCAGKDGRINGIVGLDRA